MRAPVVTGERERGDAVERCTTRFRGELRYARVERAVRGVQQEDPTWCAWQDTGKHTRHVRRRAWK
eukprot:4396640-Prymnesium_polylepis.3